MNKNHKVQDSFSFSEKQNNNMIEAALEWEALGAKLAGAVGGGIIIAMTLKSEKTRKALLNARTEKTSGI